MFNQIMLNVQLMVYVYLHVSFQSQEVLLHVQNMSSDSHPKYISFAYRQFENINGSLFKLLLQKASAKCTMYVVLTFFQKDFQFKFNVGNEFIELTC
jgi:hypothetical protein